MERRLHRLYVRIPTNLFHTFFNTSCPVCNIYSISVRCREVSWRTTESFSELGNILRKTKTKIRGNLLRTFEPPRDKTNNVAVRPAKTQISLGIRPGWSESSLCAQWVAKGPSFLHADGEDCDQSGRMPRLIWVFAGRTLTLLILSRGGSFLLYSHNLLTTECTAPFKKL